MTTRRRPGWRVTPSVLKDNNVGCEPLFFENEVGKDVVKLLLNRRITLFLTIFWGVFFGVNTPAICGFGRGRIFCWQKTSTARLGVSSKLCQTHPVLFGNGTKR